MKKKFWFILSLILFIYSGYKFWVKNRPSNFQKEFNNKRTELGLPIIPENWIPRSDYEDAVYQRWDNINEEFPAHIMKYVDCDSETRSIKAEIDIYGIIKNGKKEILSIYFDYEKNKWQCELKETIPKDDLKWRDIFGYPSKTIKVLNLNEAEKILIAQGLNRLNYK